MENRRQAMKYDKHYLLSAINIILISLICSVAYGDIQSSQNYSMKRYTLTNAGGKSSSDNDTLSRTPGQSSPITSSLSSRQRLYGGFRKSDKAVINEPDGDVAPLGNRDGSVNVGDALIALRFALTLDSPTQEDIAHGDVAPLDAQGQPSPDGVINVGDALVILRKALGLISFSVNDPSYHVAVFYYPWYGNSAVDGEWVHWNQGNIFYPPIDISSDYCPVLGAYSSIDTSVVKQHFSWLRDAKVGVIISSWWGQDTREDHAIPVLLNIANQFGIKIAFHIEPYEGRTAMRLVDDVRYLYNQYGRHPAFFRSTATSNWSTDNRSKGLFFLWAACVPDNNSSQVEANYWQAALDSVHAMPDGGLVIADQPLSTWIEEGHFDGLYNYATLHLDQSDRFRWAQGLPKGAWYVPSVIPGFSARRIGYSEDTFEPRRDGATYDLQWEAALGVYVKPAMVTITSFNEWHEGTQIEPAAENLTNGMGYTYEDYMPLPPEGYLTKTRQWVEKYLNWGWPVLCPARIRISTSSDWTTFGLKGGGGWLHPDIVSESQEAADARLEQDHFLLTQPLARAEAGGEVEMVVIIDFALIEPKEALEFYIERGHLGFTTVAIMDSQGSVIETFEWNGINPDPRNTLNVEMQTSKLKCDISSNRTMP
jgi:glycoprotein endo-alpha-1,2-mannosidase